MDRFKELRKVNIVNCTPHPIHILHGDYFKYREVKPTILVTFPNSGGYARVEYTTRLLEKVIAEGVAIDITSTKYTTVVGLPNPQPDTLYIVSKLVAEALAGQRDDLLITSGIARDKNTQVIGCRTLAKFTLLT